MNRKYDTKAILASGAFLFRRQGYHATGVSDILRESGIPKGSFYNFFQSKETFGLAVIAHYGEEMGAFIASFLEDKAKSPLDRLKAFYQGIIQVNQTEEFRYGCLVNNLSSEVCGQNEALASAADVQFQHWVARIAVCIREGQEDGSIKANRDPEVLAEMLHTSFFGALSRAKATRSIQPLEMIREVMFEWLEA